MARLYVHQLHKIGYFLLVLFTWTYFWKACIFFIDLNISAYFNITIENFWDILRLISSIYGLKICVIFWPSFYLFIICNWWLFWMLISLFVATCTSTQRMTVQFSENLIFVGENKRRVLIARDQFREVFLENCWSLRVFSLRCTFGATDFLTVWRL